MRRIGSFFVCVCVWGGGGGGGGGGQKFEFQHFFVGGGGSENEYFLGYEDLWIFFGEHHKIGLYLGVISMHFRVFS